MYKKKQVCKENRKGNHYQTKYVTKFQKVNKIGETVKQDQVAALFQQGSDTKYFRLAHPSVSGIKTKLCFCSTSCYQQYPRENMWLYSNKTTKTWL